MVSIDDMFQQVITTHEEPSEVLNDSNLESNHQSEVNSELDQSEVVPELNQPINNPDEGIKIPERCTRN